MQPFYTTRGASRGPFFMICGVSRHRHLERGCVPLWETDRNRSDDALSREISSPNASCTIGGRRFLHSVETLHRVSKSAEVGL